MEWLLELLKIFFAIGVVLAGGGFVWYIIVSIGAGIARASGVEKEKATDAGMATGNVVGVMLMVALMAYGLWIEFTTPTPDYTCTRASRVMQDIKKLDGKVVSIDQYEVDGCESEDGKFSINPNY